jgi:alkylresorcinol/alkylpyrone synthase
VARAHDYLLAHKNQAVLLLATELCSLTFQLNDSSVANLIGTGLFSDGAAAVVLVGDDHPLAKTGKLKVKDTMSVFYPNTERTMGWDITGEGFKLVLSGDVPAIVQEHVPAGVREFLDHNHLNLNEVDEIIAHPGGPKVLEALAFALDRDGSWFDHSWLSLAENGNMSSVSVLDILSRTLETPADNKKHGLLMAMGPAFCSEMVLTERQG